MSRARTFADLASAYSQDSLGKRNLLYNGDMSVAQRGTSKTGYAHDTTGYYHTVDRWAFDVGGSTGGVVTLTQDTDSTAPFPEAYKIACTTADTSIASGEYAILSQAIEGRDLARIRKGNSDAKKLTVSFWCKADASLTYGISLRDDDNNRICNSTFNVTTSWNRVSVTFPADTNGEYLTHDNTQSMTLYFWLHAGSDYTGGTFSSLTWSDTVWNTAVSSIGSIYASTSRTFYITGVQMEIGEVATAFEHESFADNLARCQRYYRSIGTIRIHTANGDPAGQIVALEPTMRAQPTVTGTSSTGGSHTIAGTGDFPNTNIIYSGTSATSGSTAFLQFTGVTADAEL